MRKLFILLVIVTPFFVIAQNATLTKKETINYLSKKTNEALNKLRTTNDGYTRYILSHNVELSNDNVVVYLERSNFLNAPYDDSRYYSQRIWQTFNPAHITEITDEGLKDNEVLSAVKIKLISKTGTFKMEAKSRTNNNYHIESLNYCAGCIDFYSPTIINPVEYIYITYLATDPSNFNKIKKALEHLRDLYKSEDDPFGN